MAVTIALVGNTITASNTGRLNLLRYVWWWR